MPKLSVLVPVYNVEKYLKICMDSILTQTLTDMEIICIDDGSTDRCPQILDEYAEKDARVQVIHKPNSGYGHSMNMGLKAAKGTYIGIVESDDKILPDMMEKLSAAAETYELDVVKCDCVAFWEDIGYEYRVHYKHIDEYYGKILKTDHRKIFYQFFMNIWAGIYRRSFLEEHQIRFRESAGASYQDNGFWVQTMAFAERLMALDYAPYYYRQDNMGASVKNPGKVQEMADEYEWVKPILVQKGNMEAAQIADYYRLARARGTYYRLADTNKYLFLDRLCRDYEKYGEAVRSDAYIENWYHEIMKDPKGYTDRLIEGKKQILERLQNADRLFCYGAGQRGEIVWRLLCSMGLAGKLDCFVTTDQPERSHIGKVPVYQISDEKVNWDGAEVILSASRVGKWRKSAIAHLYEKGVTNWIESDSILERFYLLI